MPSLIALIESLVSHQMFVQEDIAAFKMPIQNTLIQNPDTLASHASKFPYFQNSDVVIDSIGFTSAHEGYIHLDKARSPQELVLIYTGVSAFLQVSTSI